MSNLTTPTTSTAHPSLSSLAPDRNKILTVPSRPLEVIQLLVPISHLKADMELLNTGTFSDVTVICGNKEWKAHKVVLSRCAFFERAFSEKHGFKESLESKMTIRGFEEYEISWLLQYIYTMHIDIKAAIDENPNKSFLETCVLLHSIGDYFCLDGLAYIAMSHLELACGKMYYRARRLSYILAGVHHLLPDLEAAIRAAWREDRMPFPEGQRLLTQTCLGLYPYLRDSQSFSALLDEMPEFSTCLLKALMGFPCPHHDKPGPDRKAANPARYNSVCAVCCAPVPAFDIDQVSPPAADTYYMPPGSCAQAEFRPLFFCSQACHNVTVPDRYKNLE